jgi:DNA replication protein DnaC
MSGGAGTGKTHLAIGIVQHVIEKGGTGRYETVMGMLGRIKDTYNPNTNTTEQQVIDELVAYDVLVIDEVGRQLDTSYELAQLFRVLDLRYQHLKPVVLVSNLGRTALVDLLGVAIVDRLRENGGALLPFDWDSQRSKKRKRRKDEEED